MHVMMMLYAESLTPFVCTICLAGGDAAVFRRLRHVLSQGKVYCLPRQRASKGRVGRRIKEGMELVGISTHLCRAPRSPLLIHEAACGFAEDDLGGCICNVGGALQQESATRVDEMPVLAPR
jgi:hypothetical protein